MNHITFFEPDGEDMGQNVVACKLVYQQHQNLASGPHLDIWSFNLLTTASVTTRTTTDKYMLLLEGFTLGSLPDLPP